MRGPGDGGKERSCGAWEGPKGRTDRRRRRPSCAVDCTTKGAIMRPFSNHRAFCPPFDPSGAPPRPVVPLVPPLPAGAPSPWSQPTRFCPAIRARYIARRAAEGYRVFLFKCTPSTCRRAPANLNAIRGRRCDLTCCSVGGAAKKSVNERLSRFRDRGWKAYWAENWAAHNRDLELPRFLSPTNSVRTIYICTYIYLLLIFRRVEIWLNSTFLTAFTINK